MRSIQRSVPSNNGNSSLFIEYFGLAVSSSENAWYAVLTRVAGLVYLVWLLRFQALLRFCLRLILDPGKLRELRK